MSGDERDIDVESADEVPDVGLEATAATDDDPQLEDGGEGGGVDKRAHHNALERQRRDHIKDSFHSLRDCIPALHSEKVSRAHILNKATEYIRQLHKGGLLRENEISHLQRKNEVLEEQVTAIESAQTVGSSESTDAILEAVVKKIHSRQIQRQNLKSSDKLEDGKLGGKGGSLRPSSSSSSSSSSGKQNHTSLTTDNRITSKGPAHEAAAVGGGGGGGSGSQLHSINLLASNLKNTQSLINALQSANVKHLAAKVFASPIRAQVQAPSSSMPRGIVTATTVPPGNPITAANLASALKQQQLFQKQQQQQNQPPQQSDVAPSGGTPSSKLKPTTSAIATTAKTTSAITAKTLLNALTETNSSEAKIPSQKPATAAAAAAATDSPRAKSSSSSSSSAGAVSSTPGAVTAKLSPALLSQASQLLAVNSLLQTQASGAGPGGGTSSSGGAPPQLSQELLSQVTSFLTMSGGPAPSSTPLSVPAEMVDKIEDDFHQLDDNPSVADEVNPNSLLNPLPINAVLETIETPSTTGKRAAPVESLSPGTSSSSSSSSSPHRKRARLDEL